MKKYLEKNRKWILILLAVALINAFLNIGVVVSEQIAHNHEIEWPFYFINEFTGSFILIVFIPVLFRFFKEMPLRKPYLYGRIFLYLVVSLVFGILFTSLMYASRVPLYHLAGITRLDEIFNNLPYRYLMEYFKQFFAFWLIYIVYWGIQQYDHNQRIRQQEAYLKEQLLKSQLQSLQMQLNPHFFFNTLNTISNVMYQDVDRADRLISRMSNFLRNVLDLKDQPLHPLKKEIHLLQQFTDVMLERYPDKLRITYEMDEKGADFPVPVLILQPLVENAIQYAVDFKPVTEIKILVSVEGGKLFITISDNGPGITEGAATRGVGLTSTIERLQKIYGDDHVFEMFNDDGLTVKLSLSQAKR